MRNILFILFIIGIPSSQSVLACADSLEGLGNAYKAILSKTVLGQLLQTYSPFEIAKQQKVEPKIIYEAIANHQLDPFAVFTVPVEINLIYNRLNNPRWRYWERLGTQATFLEIADDLAKLGTPQSEIAFILGVSEDFLKTARETLGRHHWRRRLPFRGTLRWEADIIMDLYSRGHKPAQIARHINQLIEELKAKDPMPMDRQYSKRSLTAVRKKLIELGLLQSMQTKSPKKERKESPASSNRPKALKPRTPTVHNAETQEGRRVAPQGPRVRMISTRPSRRIEPNYHPSQHPLLGLRGPQAFVVTKILEFFQQHGRLQQSDFGLKQQQVGVFFKEFIETFPSEIEALKSLRQAAQLESFQPHFRQTTRFTLFEIELNPGHKSTPELRQLYQDELRNLLMMAFAGGDTYELKFEKITSSLPLEMKRIFGQGDYQRSGIKASQRIFNSQREAQTWLKGLYQDPDFQELALDHFLHEIHSRKGLPIPIEMGFNSEGWIYSAEHMGEALPFVSFFNEDEVVAHQAVLSKLQSHPPKRAGGLFTARQKSDYQEQIELYIEFLESGYMDYVQWYTDTYNEQ